MRALEFITGHVTFKLCYNQIYQLKTTNVPVELRIRILETSFYILVHISIYINLKKNFTKSLRFSFLY
jgi:hypothetical protein